MKRLTNIIIVICLAVSFSGCAIFLADVDGLRKIKTVHTKIINKDLPYCYELTKKILVSWNGVIFQERKNDYIVAMELDYAFRNCISTTELGVFFTEAEPGKTEIKVTSLNSQLSEFIAKNLFNYIEKDGKVPAEEALVLSSPTKGRKPW
ncbi:MAG: hypothetical protein WCY36_01260 [Candidatus Omnitrophota bacterium]